MTREHPISIWMRRNGVETQAEAAKLLDLGQQEVSDYVNWNHVPRPPKMRRLAEKLGVSVATFIPDADCKEEGAA